MNSGLTPFLTLLFAYPAAKDAVWVQEEPQNMGPWTFIAPRLAPLQFAPIRHAGRPPSASPATGNANVHKTELVEIIAKAFSE
jgi:2-oxoglutarate dehydrogenase E1 component